MKKHVVALEAAALVQLMVASVFLLGLLFFAGAVVGFAAHPDGNVEVSGPVDTETSSPAVVTAAECVAVLGDPTRAEDAP